VGSELCEQLPGEKTYGSYVSKMHRQMHGRCIGIAIGTGIGRCTEGALKMHGRCNEL